MQPDPILATKLYVPPIRPGLVSRPRLIDRLNTGITRKLTLISAPAGFGKTTLLSEWVGSMSWRVAWLSLDEGDNDPARFLAYLVAALQTVEGNAGQGALAALQSPGEFNSEAALTILINEITSQGTGPSPTDHESASGQGLILVLDDYHVIESPAIDRGVNFLLDHVPPQMKLVIASRIDPSLPLSRLRAGGQMTEIRESDLRFAPDEVADLMDRAFGLNLTQEDVAALGARTEGWIAGLQLAALSMQGLEGGAEVTGFISRFTGSDRYIQDYLTDEVLQRRPAGTNEFLLQTSILERLSGPVCDAVRFGEAEAPSIPEGTAVRFGEAEAPSIPEGTAVRSGFAGVPSSSEGPERTGQNGSQAILEALEAANLFIVPLDNERRWYRYHHLFADLLRQRLQWKLPKLVPELHRRASTWHESEGFITDAFRHALAAGNTDRAAELIEEYWQEIVHRGELTKLKGILDSLGCEVTRRSAPLSMAYCWIYLLRGTMDPILSHLANTKKVLLGEKETDTVRRPMRLAVIPSLVETVEASISLDNGQARKARAHAERAIDLIPEDATAAGRGLLHGAAGYRLAKAHKELGEYDRACAVLLDVLEMLKASENYYGVAGTVVQITALYRASGQTQGATALCKDALEYMEKHHREALLPSGMVHVALAAVQADVGAFEEAKKNLEIGRGPVGQTQSQGMAALVGQVEGKLASHRLSPQALVEPLSLRELEVLQLIAQGHSNREIGDRLFLSLSTVKGHNRRIFRKLQVQRRTEAVARARVLDLL